MEQAELFICICIHLYKYKTLICIWQLTGRKIRGGDADKGSSGGGLGVSPPTNTSKFPKVEDFLSKRDFVGALTLLEVKWEEAAHLSLRSDLHNVFLCTSIVSKERSKREAWRPGESREPHSLLRLPPGRLPEGP
jgi:hypothetical protein